MGDLLFEFNFYDYYLTIEYKCKWNDFNQKTHSLRQWIIHTHMLNTWIEISKLIETEYNCKIESKSDSLFLVHWINNKIVTIIFNHKNSNSKFKCKKKKFIALLLLLSTQYFIILCRRWWKNVKNISFHFIGT